MFGWVCGLLALYGACVHADGLVNRPPIGDHYPVLTVEKNENPQNIMIAYVKLGKKCELTPDPRDSTRPLLGFYWLMDRRRYKPVHPLILEGIRQRLEITGVSTDHHAFKLRLNELRKLKTDLRSNELVVVAHSLPKGGCTVEADMDLTSARGTGLPIRLEKIYSDASKSMWPPFRKLNSITLTGVTRADGRGAQRTYTVR